MSNGRTNRTVSGAVDVWWAVWWAVGNRTVRDAVHEAVSRAVGQAVSRAVHGSWHGDVYWALQQDPDPTALQDFLLSLKPDTRT